MDGWQYHDIGFESQTKKINGINIWKYPWNDMDEPSFEVPHPQYPDQRHKITPYFIKTKGKTLTFAAGEVSNCVWCIYVAESIT
jgi:hypothetical protein